VGVIHIDPAYTSKRCSKCGQIGTRISKQFKCLNLDCKHVDHADVNAAFNISISSESIDQSSIDRDMLDGSTDTPKEATIWML
jgi:putative transposase